MNILMVSDVFPPKCGGAGWFAFYLAEALRKNGHKISVVTAFGNADTYKDLNITIAKPLFRVFAHRSMRTKIKKMKDIDLIIANNAAATRASVNLNIPVISVVHDFWPICYKGTWFRTYNQTNGETSDWKNLFKCVFLENNILIKFLSPLIVPFMKYRVNASKKALESADAIAYNSKFVKEKIESRIKQKPSNVWFNLCAQGVDTNKIEKMEFSKPTILFVGKFTKEKGAHLVPEIAKLLPNVDFVMVGDKESKLKSIPNNIKVVPYAPQATIFSYMKSADIFIVPSLWHEPFGRILVEAMAMGAACVASARGGMKSDIIVHNQNGVLVENPSAESFAKIIKELIQNKEKLVDLGKQAQKDFLQHFNEETVIKQFNELVSQIMD